MKKIVIFACKRGRPRDVPLLRDGARAAGHRFLLVLVPFVYPVLILAALARRLGANIAVVISDRFPGDRWLAIPFGNDCARMLWNYADEFPDSLQGAPLKRVCFFEDPVHPVQLFRFAPQPRLRPLNPRTDRRQVLFIGDVSIEAMLPQGVPWWQERLAALRDQHGFAFYLTGEYEELLATHLHDVRDLRHARVLCKNLTRLWIVQSARRAIGDRLTLVGSNWRRFSLDSLPSAYSLKARLALYQSATVNLDCGSKSGDSALYPRASEIISYAGSPLQVVCRDTAMVFGERASEFSFDSESKLHDLLEQHLSEPDAKRLERATWLANHLQRRSLTMADSFRELFPAAKPRIGSATRDETLVDTGHR